MGPFRSLLYKISLYFTTQCCALFSAFTFASFLLVIFLAIFHQNIFRIAIIDRLYLEGRLELIDEDSYRSEKGKLIAQI